MAKVLHWFFLILMAVSPVMAQNVPPPQPREEAIPPFPFTEEEVRGDNGHFTSQLLNMVLMLGLLLGLLLFTSWYLKRMMQTRIQRVNDDSAIKVLEQRAVSPRTTVYALDIEGKTYVFAESPNALTSLSPVSKSFFVNEPEPDPVPEKR